MKSKIVRVLGVALVLVTMTSLMVVGSGAAPASAAAGTMAFGLVNPPSNIYNILGGKDWVDHVNTTAASLVFLTTPAATGSVNPGIVNASPDGKTIFALANSNVTVGASTWQYATVYKSIDGGLTWTASVPVGPFGAANSGLTALGMVVSPNFATDSIVAFFDSKEVWLSSNAGASFASVAPTDLGTKLGADPISSMDINNYYLTNTPSIIIGVNGVNNIATRYSNVLIFSVGGFSWAPVGQAGHFETDKVLAVAFSPNTRSDTEIMCVHIGTIAGVTATATATLGGIANNATATATIGALGTNATGTAVIATQATASATAIAGGAVTAISLGVGGSGYTSAPAVTFSGGGGTGATATTTIAGGIVTAITLGVGGSGYTSLPTVTIAAPALVGSVSYVTLVAGGTLYGAAPAVTFSGGGGTGAAATTTIAGGIVTAINVTAAGSGYTSAPTVTIAAPGASVTVLTLGLGGSGYTSAPAVTFSGGGGTGATATTTEVGGIVTAITLGVGGYGYTSAPTVTIAPSPTPASVSAVTLITGGTGYTSAPAVTFSGGGGTGATATTTIVGGVVTAITLGVGGTGYTSTPTVIIAAPGAVSGATYLSSDFSSYTLGWDQIAPQLTITSLGQATHAVIALPSDYLGNTGGAFDVAIAGTGAAAGTDNLYRITSRASSTGFATNLSIFGTGVTAPLGMIAVNGPAASAIILATYLNAPAAYIFTGTGAFAGTFVYGAVYKTPTGSGVNPSVDWAGPAGTKNAVCGTTGNDAAVSMSTDGGLTFNQVGLISVGPNSTAGTINVMSLTSLVAADANNIFLVMANSNPGVGAATQYVFKTTNGGTSWARVFTSTVATPLMVAVSGNYASDSTVVVSDGSSILRESTNGGAYFGPLAVGAPSVTELFVLDQADIYVGTALAVYKATRFTASTGIAAGNVFSIANNPKDTTHATFAIGTSVVGGGYVYVSTDDCVSFTALGSPVAGNTYVAYGPDGTLYAASSAGGIYAWINGAWLPVAGGAADIASGLTVSKDGTLYSSGAIAGQGIYRTLNPNSVNTAGSSSASWDQMNGFTFPATFPAAGVLSRGVSVISATAGNTIMAIESAATTSALTGYGYTGAIYGIVDTFIVAPGSPSPASNALLTSPTSVTLKWTAIAGAPATTTYYAMTSTDPTFVTGNLYPGAGEDAYNAAVPLQQTIGVATGAGGGILNPLSPGTTYYWLVKAATPIRSRYAFGSFTTALPTIANATSTTIFPANGGTGIPVDTTFQWPSVSGATGYQFVIAEDLGATDKFAIIDYSATTITNAHKLEENLKYDTTYWWRIRPTNGTIVGAWTVGFFTTAMAPTAATTTATTPPIVITSVHRLRSISRSRLHRPR